MKLRRSTTWLFGAIIAIASLGLSVGFTVDTSVAANTDNFRITNYRIDYDLSRDDANRSVLKTVETVTAVFPEYNQNHGFERIIPTDYQKHPTSLKITSVTDETGKKLKYSTSDSSGATRLRIGDANKYVHGQQTYVITYTQHDVTAYFGNTDADEFYWDTSGTDLRIPIDTLAINLKVSDDIAAKINNSRCYVGTYGQAGECQLERSGNAFSATASNLPRGGNISLAIGFTAHTFAEYTVPLSTVLFVTWVVLQFVLAAVVVVLIVWLSVRYSKVTNRSNEQNPIAPEYIPPRNASVSTSSALLSSARPSFTAQLVDLAVRHYIRIIETKPKSTWTGAEYDIEILQPIDELRDEEKEILNDLFGDGNAIVGARFSLKKMSNNYAISKRLLDNPTKLKSLIRDTYHLRVKDADKGKWFSRFGKITIVFAVLFLSPVLLIPALVAYALSRNMWVLSDEGLALVRYLKGLKMYIAAAEVDRIKMLQSPEGVEKSGINGSDEGQVVRLYERVLPYAILFGLEKDWNTALGKHYEIAGTQPEWFNSSSNAMFNAVVFSSALSSFTTSTTYSSYSSSSSSGGSSGGGFSGGGGGGGGGGGW